MRITSFALNLRSDSPRSRPQDLPPNTETTSAQGRLVPTEGPAPYVSLLSANPFTPPSVLSRPLGLPSNPRLALPGAQNPKTEFMLTPDTLRYLGTTVERFTAQIHDIQLAHRTAEARAALQAQELARQQHKCRELLGLIAQLRDTRHAASQEQVARVQEAQKALLARLDRVLQALMQKASPELSEHETKWFEELGRMKEEVTGAGRYDEGSLAARTALVRGWCVEREVC